MASPKKKFYVVWKGKTSKQIDDLVARALRWLNENEYNNQILKWETEAWGEVPADYGRK